MQENKDLVNHPTNDPLHARLDPTPVQLEGPEQEAGQALVQVQMTLGLQGLELVMGEERAPVMLPPCHTLISSGDYYLMIYNL